MPRRLLATIIILSLGWIAMIWGLIGLHSVLRREREAGRGDILREREVLELYAERSLRHRLERLLDASMGAIEAAQDDPLLASSHLLLVESGKQRLPRLFVHKSGHRGTALDLFRSFQLGKEPAAASFPQPERRELYRTMARAVERGSEQAIENSVRAYLAHVVHFRVQPENELPSLLGILSYLDRESSPSTELMRAILLGGIQSQSSEQLPSMAEILIRHRDRFSFEEEDFLGGEILRLAADYDLATDNLSARLQEGSGEIVELSPELVGLSILEEGKWVARKDSAERVVGITISIPRLLGELDSEMKGRGLLDPGDRVEVLSSLHSPLGLNDLHLTIHSERWQELLQGLDARYRRETALVILSGMLAMAVGGLFVAYQVRRIRLIELRSMFVATVSHELRTPLASVRILAETVARRSLEQTGLRDYPAKIIQKIDQLNFLVENILSFHRLEQRRVVTHVAKVHLEELAQSVTSEIEAQTGRHLVATVQPSNLEVQADPDLLVLLMRNLVRNASQYGDRDPVELQIDGTSKGRGITEILVTDNARGIPDVEQDRIFDDFYSIPDSRGGTGLGLAICRRIMAAHGGRILVRSSSSEGSTFLLEFPSS